jgi:hypothetical protein
MQARETEKHTVTLTRPQLVALLLVSQEVIREGICVHKSIPECHHKPLLEGSNLLQKSYDFPDWKF